ncbi:MAG TPA: thioredoxin [Firmicutes bacterium]|nr:thioredoxin [Bacillota bacterium]
MSTVHFDKAGFESQVEQGKGVALVDFWATWCGPCRMMGPIIDQMADELDGQVLVGKVDVDQEGDLAAKYGVMSIPTLVFFKDGQEVKRLVGAVPKGTLESALEEVK